MPKTIVKTYQIIATDENDTKYVIFSSEELEAAKNKYLFISEVIESGISVSMIVNLPSFTSLELQRVEKIEV